LYFVNVTPLSFNGKLIMIYMKLSFKGNI